MKGVWIQAFYRLRVENRNINYLENIVNQN
jgi:hypothetical protein